MPSSDSEWRHALPTAVSRASEYINLPSCRRNPCPQTRQSVESPNPAIGETLAQGGSFRGQAGLGYVVVLSQALASREGRRKAPPCSGESRPSLCVMKDTELEKL